MGKKTPKDNDYSTLVYLFSAFLCPPQVVSIVEIDPENDFYRARGGLGLVRYCKWALLSGQDIKSPAVGPGAPAGQGVEAACEGG